MNRTIKKRKTKVLIVVLYCFLQNDKKEKGTAGESDEKAKSNKSKDADDEQVYLFSA